MSGLSARLRDARFGRIVDTQVIDATGAFAFEQVDPGVYIVEIVRGEQILAASDIISTNAGELITAGVRIPSGPPLAGVLGSSTSSAAVVAAEAAAAGVLSTTPTEPVSPVQ